MNTAQPVVCVDAVSFVMDAQRGLRVCLIRRQFAPYARRRALPGVMLNPGESAHDAARRALSTKAGIGDGDIGWQAAGRYYDEANRDPRGATISLTQVVALRPGTLGWDDDRWATLDDLPSMPFGHNAIIGEVMASLGASIWTQTPIFTALLGEVFSTVDVRNLLAALGAPQNSNLHRLCAAHFTDAGSSGGVQGRPARLWSVPE